MCGWGWTWVTVWERVDMGECVVRVNRGECVGEGGHG